MTYQTAQLVKSGWLDIEERATLREVIDVQARVTGELVPPSPVRVVDISSRGCRVLASEPIIAGRFVTITILEFSFQGWVAWVSPQTYGIDFAHPVPGPVVSYLLKLNSQGAS